MAYIIHTYSNSKVPVTLVKVLLFNHRFCFHVARYIDYGGISIRLFNWQLVPSQHL